MTYFTIYITEGRISLAALRHRIKKIMFDALSWAINVVGSLAYIIQVWPC